MEREELLALRRQARADKDRIDEHRLQVHRRIVELLYRGDADSKVVRNQALGQIEKWERNQICHPRYIVRWREWLDMPASFGKAAILSENDIGVSMRQNSPFHHLIAKLA